MIPARAATVLLTMCLLAGSAPSLASDWEEDPRSSRSSGSSSDYGSDSGSGTSSGSRSSGSSSDYGSDSGSGTSGRSGSSGSSASTPGDMPEPAAPKKKKRKPITARIEHNALDGNASNSALKGGAEDSGGDLRPMDGRIDENTGRLHGGARIEDSGLQAQDPDFEDQQLQVEWDRWRNRFLRAVQSGVQEALNNPDDTMLRWDPARNAVVMRFPLGTVAWFSCKVSNDRRIERLKLMKSSGFPNFDQAVIDAVRNLEGTTILRFPKRSRRISVSQTAGIKTSDSAEQQYFHFGDVERYRVPGRY